MKTLPKKKWASLFLLSLLIACGTSFSQPALPAKWPADMVLKVTYGGGMQYYSSTLEIRTTGSYILINDQGKETKTELSFTQQDLDQLLKFFRANDFASIRSDMRPGIVYDMGTTSTILTWGEQVLGMSVGSSQEIPEKYRSRYNAIDNYIDTLVAKKLKH